MRDLLLVEPDVLVGPDVVTEPPVWLRRGSRLVADVTIATGSFVGFRSVLRSCELGKSCLVAAGARIEGGRTRTVLRDGVWVGARAVIREHVTIESGAIVAAGADVHDDVPEMSIAMGSPARIFERSTVVDDGLPDITNILTNVMRRRSISGRDHTVPPPGWSIGSGTYIDADVYGENAAIGANCFLIGHRDQPSQRGGISLGDHVTIDHGCILEGTGGIDVGERTEIGSDTYILSSGHNTQFRSLPWQAAPITIGSHVSIGSGSTLIGPLIIGDNARVAPNSLIIHDIPQDGISHGVLHISAIPEGAPS